MAGDSRQLRASRAGEAIAGLRKAAPRRPRGRTSTKEVRNIEQSSSNHASPSSSAPARAAPIRWAASARSSRPTATRRARATRYPSGGWSRTPAGPGPHSHDEDDLFFVLEGTMSFMVGDAWTDAPAGSFILIPGGVTHDFQNRGDARTGALNFSAPGDFEPHMPGIVEWFLAHPPGSA